MRTILGILGVLAIAFLLGLGGCTVYRTGSLPGLQTQVNGLEGKVGWLVDDAQKKEKTAAKNHADEMAAIAAIDACKCNVPVPKPRPVVRRRPVPPRPAPPVQMVCPVNCTEVSGGALDNSQLTRRVDALEQRVSNVEKGQEDLKQEIRSSRDEILQEIRSKPHPPAQPPIPPKKKHWWNHCEGDCRS